MALEHEPAVEVFRDFLAGTWFSVSTINDNIYLLDRWNR